MKSDNNNHNPFFIPAIAIIATLIIGFGSIGGFLISINLAWKDSILSLQDAQSSKLDARLSKIESKLDSVIERYDNRFSNIEENQKSLEQEQIRTSQNLTNYLSSTK